jgi:hypothetical protein
VPDVVNQYAWAIWLAVPVVITLLVAIVVWWRGRARRPPTVNQTLAEHARYLAALGAAIRPAATARATSTESDDPARTAPPLVAEPGATNSPG